MLVNISLQLTRISCSSLPSEYRKIPSLKIWNPSYTMKTILNEIRRQMCDKSQLKNKQPPEGSRFL